MQLQVHFLTYGFLAEVTGSYENALVKSSVGRYETMGTNIKLQLKWSYQVQWVPYLCDE